MTTSVETSGSGYRFFPGNRFSWEAIKDTYQDCFKSGFSFWTNQTYKIPLRTTASVLIGLIAIESIIEGLVGARYNFLSQFTGNLGVLFVQCVFLGFVLLMKEWLEARGTSEEYLAFCTYSHFVMLPVKLISAGLPQLGALFKILTILWILVGFYKAFQLVWSRFLVLAGIVLGIGLLGFLAAFFAGLKLLI
jgi:hypothetical protein